MTLAGKIVGVLSAMPAWLRNSILRVALVIGLSQARASLRKFGERCKYFFTLQWLRKSDEDRKEEEEQELEKLEAEQEQMEEEAEQRDEAMHEILDNADVKKMDVL